MNISEILIDPTVHEFAKQIIMESFRHDVVDAIADIELALEAVKSRFPPIQHTGSNRIEP
jgi:hypothetical protein